MTSVVLIMPDHPGAFSATRFLRLPIETLLVGFGFLLLGGVWFRLLRMFCVALLILILCLKLADIGTQAAFQRPFNPYLDIKMVLDGWRLLSSAIGLPIAFLTVATGIVAIFLFVLLYVWSAGLIALLPSGLRRVLSGVIFCLLLLTGAGLATERYLGLDLRIAANTPTYLSTRLALISRSIADMRAFEMQLAQRDPDSPAGSKLFGRIENKDVVLVFIESYGRSAVEDPLYAADVRSRLGQIEQQVGAAGLHAVSSWVQSPTVGGLSWLAHGTFLSGLWIDNQARYDRLMLSGQPSLNKMFRQAGWRTVGVMPAITMDWPEASYYGYDRLLVAANLGYAGKPFNWVTMPDQYTLSAFERLERPPGHPPVMAEIALISSHAPWTPIPRLIDWASVGDGKVFNAQAESGDPPSVVWADPKRIQSQYLLSVDYSLEILGSYMALHGKNTVFILLGDHQPASVITGADASRAVPIHIVSDDAAVIEDFRARGWAAGMTPATNGAVLPMDRMRDLLLQTLSGSAAPG
jgi:hypothetical protein